MLFLSHHYRVCSQQNRRHSANPAAFEPNLTRIGFIRIQLLEVGKEQKVKFLFSLGFACQLHVSLFYKVHLQMKSLTILFFKRDQKTEKNFIDRCPLNCTLLYHYRSKPLVRGRQSLKLIGRTKVKARRAPINSLSFATRFYF